MTNEEFQRLSTEEKIAYLRQAVEALQDGQAVTTPNGPFDPQEKSRRGG